MSEPTKPVFLRAAEAEVLGEGPSRVTLLADVSTTNGALTSQRVTLDLGADGATPHHHAKSTEVFFVLSGSLEVLLDDQIVTAQAGDMLVVPPGTVHAFGAAPGEHADALIIFAPGVERFDYFRLLDRVRRGKADDQEITDSQERFDNHFVDSPLWREHRAASRALSCTAR